MTTPSSTTSVIAVAGSGAMGSGIAQVAAAAGHTVFLYDNNPQALDRARASLHDTYQRLVAKGKLTEAEAEAILQRIHGVASLKDCGQAELVIEAIVEDLGVKRELFNTLEAIVSPQAILATNTSSLSVAAIAAACRHPERVLGLHFFNPPPLMALVEVIPAVQTQPAITQQALALMRSWGKTPVLAKDTPGFIVNRVARPFYGEALRIYEEGLADIPTIDWALTELGGFRMGPFTLMDYIGHDVNYRVTESVFAAFYYDPRYRPSFTQLRLLEAGWLGRKSGQGFYHYGPTAPPQPEPRRDPQLGHTILHRILAMLINEAADALYLGIASRDDLDLAMTRGVNYPQGLLHWADQWGIPQVVATLDALYHEYHEDRYRCSPLLRRMEREGKGFWG